MKKIVLMIILTNMFAIYAQEKVVQLRCMKTYTIVQIHNHTIALERYDAGRYQNVLGYVIAQSSYGVIML